MKSSKPALVLGLALIAATGSAAAAAGGGHPPIPTARTGRADRFRQQGTVADEDVARDLGSAHAVADLGNLVEAPTGFANRTNGYTEQGPAFATLDEDSVVPLRSFNDDRFVFEEVETAADGLGPVYNAQSCGECHQSVVTGGASQVAEHRTGRTDHEVFFESIGGSLIQSRATDASLVEHAAVEDDISTFRLSTNTLGDGFVECIANSTLLAIRDRQPRPMRGTALAVPVLEADGRVRIGRFGWKCQHASLESFAGDAYVNEMGVTNPLFPEENTSSGRFVGYGSGFDPLPDPEDDGNDVLAFADFMRATEAPPRGPSSADVAAGEPIFNAVGCAVCHTPAIATAHPGTVVNGGEFRVPAALGDKIIHPYSDFLLHDIGTGDGIPVLPEMPSTADQIRTAPLWGLRTRNRLMHDGLTFTVEEAIRRHGGQATRATRRFSALSTDDQQRLLAFLASL
jgi:CxxC motif-containing protein (DUF1111 family)